MIRYFQYHEGDFIYCLLNYLGLISGSCSQYASWGKIEIIFPEQ